MYKNTYDILYTNQNGSIVCCNSKGGQLIENKEKLRLENNNTQSKEENKMTTEQKEALNEFVNVLARIVEKYGKEILKK